MWILVVLLLIQSAISTVLSVLNLAHLKQAAASPPQEWAERLDTSQFPRMIAYTAAGPDSTTEGVAGPHIAGPART